MQPRHLCFGTRNRHSWKHTGAPATTVAPLKLTENPKLSLAAPSADVTFPANCDVVFHPSFGLRKRYVSPCQ